MRLVFKIFFAILANAVGLWAAARYIPGFKLTDDWVKIVELGAVLTVMNFVLKPIFKLFFGPLILLTLGLGLVIVNAVILYILDIYSPSLTIETIPALIYSTILIGLINFVFHIFV